MTILNRIHRWFDYDEREERRIAARSKAVDLDIALAGATVTHEQVADAIRRGTTTLRTFPTALLKPQDVDRATREVMALLERERPVQPWPALAQITADERRNDGRAVR